MSISTTDLKIFQAQRNRDTADGGGAMSPNEVEDGDLNNLFDDISSEDRVGGRVSIRKAFPGVFSDNDDRFFGAGLLIIEPAEDEAVDVVMTRKTEYDDERSDVVERIEAYLVPGASQLWRLLNDHREGTGTLTLFAPSSVPNPNLGDTWFLEDTATEETEAVRIQKIQSRTTQTFYDGSGSFQRDVLVLELSRPLQADWEGGEVERVTTSTPATRLRGSTVSDGARYYGVKKILEDITEDDLTLKVGNPFARIVPSTTSEEPVTDERASLSEVSYTQVGDTDAISRSTGNTSFDSGETKTFHLGGTVLPGSVTVSGSVDGTDNGDGTLEFSGSSTTGTVDYENGAVTITRNSSGSISLTLTATPAAAVQDSTHTIQVPITSSNRGTTYVRTLRPTPAPGTVSVDYRALNSWYRLSDDGSGSLEGQSPGQGGGSVNYSTGSVTATLAREPDVGTVIIFSWGTPSTVENISGDISLDAPEIKTTLSAPPVKPGTVAIEYLSDSSTINLEDDGEGNIVEQGQTTSLGRIVYSTGALAFRPNDWPDDDAVVTIDYEQSSEQQENFSPTPSGSTDDISFTLSNTPVRQGSVRIEFSVQASYRGVTRNRTIRIVDDGQGGLVYDSPYVDGAVAGGTINYSDGSVSLQALTEVPLPIPTWEYQEYEYQGGTAFGPVFVGYTDVDRDGRFEAGNTVNVWYQEDGASSSTEQDTTTMPPVEVNFMPLLADRIVPGSLRFTLNGRTYVDRQGDLVYDPSVTTNAGTVAGTVDYTAGTAKITDWASGSFEISVVGGGRQDGVAPTDRIFFRTPAAPIAQGSLTIQANTLEDSTLLQTTADNNGVLSASLIEGTVDVETGIVDVRFGEMVSAAGNEDEWWYDEDGVDGNGDIWKPTMIQPDTAKFSCVVLQSIPLDPDILGLDPIMLPTDGKVPVFEPGDSLMIVQRNQVEDSDPQAGETVDLGITNVKWVRVRDANDEEVLDEHYTVDGPAGELTWANPLDLSAYTGPYTITSLAYFKRLCSDVQINGDISIASGAPFSMATADADIFLCSKLIFKPDGGNQDLQALYTNLFTQEAWTGEWSDDPIGGGTDGAFDDVNYPPVMVNNGSITERWRLEFVTTDTVNVIGERFGQVLTEASITSDIAPNNPATGTPYFTLEKEGWSGGWDVGNVLRFNTLGANDPVWFIRSTQPGDAPELPSDQFIAHLQGDTAQEES
ncbi:MAG: hypothetical protein ACOC8P_00510 [Dichotomicrobium sp.]